MKLHVLQSQILFKVASLNEFRVFLVKVSHLMSFFVYREQILLSATEREQNVYFFLVLLQILYIYSLRGSATFLKVDTELHNATKVEEHGRRASIISF